MLRLVPILLTTALALGYFPRGRLAVVAADQAPVPRIESVVPADKQPQADAKATIWFDDFETAKNYSEEQGSREGPCLGGDGEAMIGLYEKGKQGIGNRKVCFGDAPFWCIARKGEKFDAVYWRVYVKHQPGWISGKQVVDGKEVDYHGPDKLSRATCFVDKDIWKQAMFCHVWSSGDSLTLDNASGVKDGKVVTTKYNDFDNMRLVGGNKPVSATLVHATDEAGWWVCVEAYARLNTPGKADGEAKLWIDGRLECERSGMDWRGTYGEYGINAIFLETYWNDGSPVEQRRWYDNFIISTEQIGPVVCPSKPELIKTPLEDCDDWEAEIVSDEAAKEIVWKSKGLGNDDRAAVNSANGKFSGLAAKKKELPTGTYWCRVRQKGEKSSWSDWSRWHQAFRVE